MVGHIARWLRDEEAEAQGVTPVRRHAPVRLCGLLPNHALLDQGGAAMRRLGPSDLNGLSVMQPRYSKKPHLLTPVVDHARIAST